MEWGIYEYCGSDKHRFKFLKKSVFVIRQGKVIDGHSPGLKGDDLSAYVTAGIHTDHESGSLEELKERLRNGMYVMLRYGSACRELPMLKGVNEQNSDVVFFVPTIYSL